MGAWIARVRGLVWLSDQRLQGGYGLDLVASVEIEGGFYLPHPAGSAINATRIGSNVMVIGAVTIGMRGPNEGPVIGDRAYVGAGATVIGSVRVGAGARIGARAEVLENVPEDVTVVGIPARVVS